ncbi:MAG: 3-deoxy-D-manno-octulosonate 8-phosphate phosphatase [Flavobacteriaceae bacterium]|nr:MAG: 3-deoxy-D-manno-octulosonate 8-phosphate phosphatase [Flavobacteriaceae bacterium]
MLSYKQILPQIDTFIFDVDGVLTNGEVTLYPDGSQVRVMHTKDGYAMQLAVKLGFRIFVISGGRDPMVKQRLLGLGVQEVILGSKNKREDYLVLADQYGLKSENVLYMGDDIPDYNVLQMVGLGCCPRDAAPEIRSIAGYISNYKGGEGCVRDVIEQTLKVQGKWEVVGENSIQSI